MTEIEGVLKSVSATQLVVTDEHGNDVTVNITKDTIFNGGDVPITVNDLAAGDHVEIRAAVQPDKTLNALVVKVEKEVFEIVGVIKSVSPTQLVITDAQGTDTTVMITTETMIRHGDQILTAGDLKIGDLVEVKAIQAGTALNALIVKVEENEPDQDEDVGVAGIVSAVGTTSITVTTESHGDVTVNVDANTRIRKGSQTIAIGDIKKGDHVAAEGTRVDAHTILARIIQVAPATQHGG